MQYVSEELVEKWTPVLEHADLPEIKDAHRKSVTATLLENQQRASREDAQGSGGYQMPTLLGEASPTNAMGGSAAPSSSPSPESSHEFKQIGSCQCRTSWGYADVFIYQLQEIEL